MNAKAIKPGDRFKKADSVFPSVWIVTRVIRAPGVPTHFMLTDTEGRNEVRTISEPTLTDPSFYSALPPLRASHDDGPSNGGAEHHAVHAAQPVVAPERSEARAIPAERTAEARPTWLEDLGLRGLGASGPSRAR